MSDSSVCDNCKREPTPFQTEDGQTAYWLRVPKENQDPSILTSALDFAFCAMVPENDDKRHPDNDPMFAEVLSPMTEGKKPSRLSR